MQPPSHDETQPQSHQFSNHPQFQHVQPQMMLCPVQFVYEPQLMVQPEEPVVPPNQNPSFQNQGFLFNVQNTPPWIQNRPNMVYMPQMQMANMQPYIHQQMVPNPMYHYQYQPMIMHDQMRHIVPYMNQNVMQNPQMVQNMVQNPQSMVQNATQNQPPIPNSPNVMSTQNVIQHPMRMQMEQKRASPMLTQILQNNMAKQAPSQHSEFTPSLQIIRPHFQNVRPQMIIVNPIAPNHTCMHTQKEAPNATFDKPKPEVPMQIRKQIPDGLSVKTVFKLSSAALARPDYVQNIAPVDEAHPRVYPKPVVKPVSNRDPQTNYKRKIREIQEQNTKEEVVKRVCVVNQPQVPNKPTLLLVDMPPANAILSQNINTGSVAIERLQNEQNAPGRKDKLLRNTVYVQARGVVTEPPKPEMQNASSSVESHQNANLVKVKFGVPIENKIQTEASLTDASVNISLVDRGENRNNSQNDNVMPKPVMNSSSVTQNDLTITEVLPTSNANIVTDNNITITQALPPKEVEPSFLDVTKDSTIPTKLPNVAESDDAKLRKILDKARFIHTDDLHKTISQNNSKMAQLHNDNECDDIKVRKNPKINQFLHSDDADGTMTRNNSKMTKILLSSNADKVKTQKEPDMKSKELSTAQTESNSKGAETKSKLAPEDITKEKRKGYVLTHVLDGHIIQESNIPFLVYKPILMRKSMSPPVATDDRTASDSSKTEQSSRNSEENELRTNSEAKELRTNSETNELRTNSEAKELRTNSETNELRTNSEAKELRTNSEAKKMRTNSEAKELRTNSEAKELRTNSETNELRTNSEAKELRTNSEAKELRTNSEAKELRTNSEAKELRTNSEAKELRTNSKAKKLRTNSEAKELRTNSEANELRTKDANLEPMSSDEETELSIIHTEDAAETNTEIEEDAELVIAEPASVTAQRNEDDPFEFLSVSTVKNWSVSDLASHLMEHETWQETAQRLLEEEIDGVSLLLVNEEQLLQIGISEEHVDVLSAFLRK